LNLIVVGVIVDDVVIIVIGVVFTLFVVVATVVIEPFLTFSTILCEMLCAERSGSRGSDAEACQLAATWSIHQNREIRTLNMVFLEILKFL
jgi:hypothetical protein